ncbi:MAG TPA: hypothetical protein VJT31_12800 [Rugosimonospora sp.]|nr:hypothetical protein [Rugosimonospora sp.]
MTRHATPLGAIRESHVDPDGHVWHLTVHWARINGTAVPVGLDLHAYTQTPTRMQPTGGVLTAAVLRSVRVAAVVEATRRHGAWPTTPPPRQPKPRRAPQAGTRGAGRPVERGDDFIAEVAALYREAKAVGGEPARKPWRYVAEQLEARGVPGVTDGQLKNWSRRAKNLGLLPTTRRAGRV